jgi:hypothetical protein
MSMHIRDVSIPSTAPDCHDHDQYLFAHSVQERRQELGLSIFEAAELSGLTVFQWAAVEDGAWVPEDRNAIRSMAGTLQANAFQMILVASLSAWALSGYKTEKPSI